MKNISYLLLFLFLFIGCTPSPYPKNPNYGIKKPAVKYKPSKKNLEKMIKQLQGSPYVWAEEGPNQFDCSGFTYYMYGSMGIEIPRVARHQARVGKRVAPKELKYGDLLFFATSKKSRKKITHVGVYLGNGWFTHASTVKHKVIYSNLFRSSYYKNRLRVCRRYLPEHKSDTAKTSEPVWEKAKKNQISTKPSTPKENTYAYKNESKSQKAIVIQAPIEEIEQTQSQGNYYIQVGSFIGQPKQSLIDKIKKLGFSHTIIKFPKGGREISKLLIGPYKTKSQANTNLKKAKKTIHKDAFIAEIR